MTAYVFSNMSAADATAFNIAGGFFEGVSSDSISFDVSAASLVFSTQSDNSIFTKETVTISDGRTSLDFISNAGIFNGSPGDFYKYSSSSSFVFSDGSRLILGDDQASSEEDDNSNTITGTTLSDQFFGLGGNDTFTGAAGNDKIDGGDGLDTSVYGVARSGATITTSGTTITIVADGTDTLTTIERLKFSDGTLAFDLDGSAGQTFRLYRAAFDREPDQGGLSHNINLMDGGLSIFDMASAFIGSAEFKQTYGDGINDTAFLTLLYQNVLNRAPDQAGLDGWLSQLSSGETDRQHVLFGFSEGAENKAATASLTDDGIWLG